MDEFLQQNEINENNANLIFKPKFIPFYPDLIEDGLTISEALIYWFIDFYLNRNDKFYFTNEQIWSIFWFWERNTILVINKLKEKWLIETNYSIKANWWKIRFIKKCSSEVKNFSVPKWKILSYNNNKINNNKINKKENNNILSNDNILLQKKQKSFLEIFENEINNEDFISLLKAKYNLEDAYLKKVAGDFCLYRTEKNPNGRKEKWQMQKTFDIKRRFYTRLNNDKKYKKTFTPKNSIWVIE